MKITAIILFALATAVASADFSETLQIWKDGDRAVQEIHHQQYLEYSDDQLSELLPHLAKWIPIQEELERHPDDSWKEFESGRDWTTFLKALPSDHPILKKVTMSLKAAWVIRVLSENRRIDQESLLPILIEGVVHPLSPFTGRDCYYALTDLTKLCGGQFIPYSNEARMISNWFLTWHAANRDKKLIVTTDRENEIKREFLLLCAHLEELVSDRSHGLHGFRAPTETKFHRMGQPLFDGQWDGQIRSTIPGEVYGSGWVRILVRPQTKLIKVTRAWQLDPPWDALEVLPEGTRLIYSRPFEDSDWILEVYVHRLKDEEIEALSSGLEKMAQNKTRLDNPLPDSCRNGILDFKP